jgi:flagellar hook-basal body complex protein FliE
MIDGGASGAAAAGGGTEAASGFGDVLRGKLGELNESQATANQAAQDLATGDIDDIARTMMQVEQANVSLQMATQLRNKAVEAYQEILRMQI